MIEATSIHTQGGAYIKGGVTVYGDFSGRDGANKPSPQDISQARDNYLQWLIDRNEYLDTRGTFQTQRQVQLKLDEVYIGLRAQADERFNDSDRKALEHERRELEARLTASDLSDEEQEEQLDDLFYRWDRRPEAPRSLTPIPLAQATATHERLVILGDPGSGKTTLLSYLALQHARALRDGRAQVHLSGEEHKSAHFPILIRIADYANEGIWKRERLSDFLAHYFDHQECPADGMADLLKSELGQGGCLLLLDGLDEIVDAHDRRGIVHNIENFVRAHDQKGPRGTNRFIITSRIAGYRSAPVNAVSGEPFAHYVVEEMALDQMEHFLTRWCQAVEDAETPELPVNARHATAQREIDGIMAAIRTNPGVKRLASNPLMLRILALIHRTGSRLPQKRIELYKLAADTLARTWRPAQGVPESVLVEDHFLTPLLGQLAYWLHLHKPTGIATEQEVYDQLGKAYCELQELPPWNPNQPNPAVITEIKKFLAAVREHTGIFVERAPQRYGFMHLTFEEYYTARHLVADSWERAKLIRQHLHDPRWQEPILLALGFLGLDYRLETSRLFEAAVLAQGKEAEVAGLEPSRYEELLGRDYLFALRCLGDQIPANRSTLERLMERLADELLYQNGLARFQAYRTQLEERLSLLGGSPAGEKLAPLFLPSLADDSSSVRTRSIECLGELGECNSEVIVALVTAFKDDSSAVRSHAAWSLTRLGEASSEVITALVALLKDKDSDVRARAAESLVRLGESSSEIVTILIATLKDKYSNMRSRAAWSLGKLGKANSEIITALIAALKDENPDVRESAAGSLGKLGEASSEVISALITALNSNAVRYSAVGDLGRLSGAVSEVVIVLIAALKDDDSDDPDDSGAMRSRAARGLGELGETNSEVITALILALKDGSSAVRSHAAQSLGKLGEASSEVITALISALKDDSSSVRYRAAWSLGDLGNVCYEVITALISALKDDSWKVRFRATWSLGDLGEVNNEVITALITALKDDERDVRSRAAWSLGDLGEASSEVTTALITALKDDSSFVRYRAAWSMGYLDEANSEVITALIIALKDDEWNVRYRATWSLTKLGESGSEVITALIAAIEQANSYTTRRDIAKLVGEFCTVEPNVLNGLQYGLLDDDDEVRGACAAALAQLGKRFPQNSLPIEDVLVRTVNDPAFEKNDRYKNRTGQDYAYDALWEVVVG